MMVDGELLEGVDGVTVDQVNFFQGNKHVEIDETNLNCSLSL